MWLLKSIGKLILCAITLYISAIALVFISGGLGKEVGVAWMLLIGLSISRLYDGIPKYIAFCVGSILGLLNYAPYLILMLIAAPVLVGVVVSVKAIKNSIAETIREFKDWCRMKPTSEFFDHHKADERMSRSSSCSSDASDTNTPSEMHDDIVHFNPATGLPMVGGIGGVDVAGNPYGIDMSAHMHASHSNHHLPHHDHWPHHHTLFKED